MERYIGIDNVCAWPNLTNMKPLDIGSRRELFVDGKQGTDLSALAGRPVRLRFVINDADLYVLQFR